MKINEIKEQDFLSRFPKLGNNDYSKMNNEQKKMYLDLYNLYRKLFTEYIIETLDLKKNDEKISKSELKFKSIQNEQMDMYQYFSSNELKYFYIRNNIYIEKLSNSEKNELIQMLNDKNQHLNDKAVTLIESTYPKVIFEDLVKDGQKYKTFYGPDNLNFAAENDSLVIGMRYDEFDLNGMDDKTWEDNHIEQILYLSEIFMDIKLNNKNNIKCPIEIIRYNEASIKPRQIGEKKTINKEEEER